MKVDNKYLKKYKKSMLSIMKDMFPNEDDDKLEKIILDMIKERIQDPIVTLDNNFTHEQRETTALAVLDWCLEKDPIIAGNGTFYKNQEQSINPIAKMLENFLSKRKAYKKEMFKIEDTQSPKYKEFDLRQSIEKINANSYYGASGAPSSAFYSLYSGPATTASAQSVISTAEQMFEGFIADNYIFLNLTEAIEWINAAMKSFLNGDEFIDDFIQLKSTYEVSDRILSKIMNPCDDDEEVLLSYLDKFSDKELSVIYYKNNMEEFIRDHEEIQDLILEIFENVENLEYVDKKDDNWFKHIPDEYKVDFRGKTQKDWNKFVDRSFFLDPNNPPETITETLHALNTYIFKYVYCRYLSVDRIYRLKNFNRRVVTVIDTDSNILSMDTICNFILKEVVNGRTFRRSKENNDFIIVNMMAYLLTNAVTDILLYYGEKSNIPEDYRPIYNMKNEFYFSRLLIGKTKKRYISKILLREGNLMNPPKKDIKGFDFKKATCSEFAENFYMKLLTKYVIEEENSINLKGILQELTDFKRKIHDSIMNGETTYLPNASAKEMGAYKDPSSQQSVGAVMAWNMIETENQIELPAKVSLLKLNIFEESDITDMQYKYPDVYNKIIENIFNDATGIFVTKKWDNGISIVNPKLKEWWKEIPKKYQTKKVKDAGVEAWNEFAESYDKDTSGQYIIKSKGLQVIAIPSNAEIPEWCKPYIDYDVVIDNILAPFTPVLEIFKSKQLKHGKTRNGVDRSSTGFSTLIKF